MTHGLQSHLNILKVAAYRPVRGSGKAARTSSYRPIRGERGDVVLGGTTG
jgi:hypothetical protein